jgi:hypothetical protein
MRLRKLNFSTTALCVHRTVVPRVVLTHYCNRKCSTLFIVVGQGTHSSDALQNVPLHSGIVSRRLL